MNIYNTEEVILNKITSFPIKRGLDYKKEIEKSLKYLYELYKDTILLKPYKYCITKEYNDIVILTLDDKGKIKVNQ